MSIITAVLLVAGTNVASFVFGLLIARTHNPKCLHDWKVVDKHVEPSESDKVRATGNALEYRGPAGEAARLSRGTYVCIMACTKCGAIDKTVEAV